MRKFAQLAIRSRSKNLWVFLVCIGVDQTLSVYYRHKCMRKLAVSHKSGQALDWTMDWRTEITI